MSDGRVQPDEQGGNPIRALIGRGSLYTVATALQLSAGVLVLPALTRVIGPAEMGVVALAVVVQSLLGTAAAAGLPAAASRTFFRADDGRRRAPLLLRYCLAISVGLALVAELSGPSWIQLFSDLEYDLAMRLAVWSAVPIALLLCAQALLRAEDRAGPFVVTAVGAFGLSQVAGLTVVLATDEGATGYLAGLVGTQAAFATLAALWAGIASASSRAGSASLAREALKVGLPTVPHSLAIYVLAAGDRAVVESIEGLAAVGKYQVAYAVGALALSVLYAFNNAWTPILFGEREERRWRTLAETRALLFHLGGLLAASLALGAPIALALAAPSSYDPEQLVGVTALVTLAAVPMVSYLAAAHVVIWEGRTGVMAWTTPLSAAVNIALNVALIPAFGLEGAAVATVLSYTLLAALTTRAANRLAEIPRDRGSFQLAAACTVAAAMASILLPTDGLWLAGRGVASVALGLVALGYALKRLRSARSEPARAPATV